jgi:histidinol-phosphatase
MDRDLAFALDLADLADALTLRRFGAVDLRVETKPDLTPVTDADRAVERALRERVAAELQPRACSARRKGTTAGGPRVG